MEVVLDTTHGRAIGSVCRLGAGPFGFRGLTRRDSAMNPFDVQSPISRKVWQNKKMDMRMRFVLVTDNARDVLPEVLIEPSNCSPLPISEVLPIALRHSIERDRVARHTREQDWSIFA